MKRLASRIRLDSRILAFIGVFLVTGAIQSQGLILPGAGAAHRSMAGVSMAAPIDAAGAGYWNPAAIRALKNNEIMFAAELIYADTHASSFVPAGAVGGGFPVTDRGGTSFSNSGLAAVPNIAFNYSPEGSIHTVGLGVYGLMGGGVNFAGSDTNPIFTRYNPPPVLGGTGTPPFTLGFGPTSATAMALSVQPTLATQVTDRLTIGASLMVTQLSLTIDPFFPDPNADGSFPYATHTRPVWGGGFKLGMHYQATDNLSFGLSYLSPHWFERLEYNSADETQAPKKLTLNVSLPQIVSAGIAYRMHESTLLACDVRWLNYAETDTFGDSPINGGLGWRDVYSIALGAQHQLTPYFSLQAGYLFNTNPIDSTLTLFNVQLPAITQHQASLGATHRLTENIAFDLAMIYAFQNSISGGIIQVPGTAVQIDAELISLAFGLRVNW